MDWKKVIVGNPPKRSAAANLRTHYSAHTAVEEGDFERWA
jgi:hypothetical protein